MCVQWRRKSEGRERGKKEEKEMVASERTNDTVMDKISMIFIKDIHQIKIVTTPNGFTVLPSALKFCDT